MENLLGEIRVLQRLNDYEFGVELMVMRDGVNRNNWDYQNIDKYYSTFVGTPILCAYVGSKVGDGHNMRVKKDPLTGKESHSFMDGTAERIVGTLSDDLEDFEIVEQDGSKWIKAKGRLFAFYAPELVEKIVRTGRMEVSAETEVKESHKDGDVEVFTEWAGLGVTVLGDDVAPAIPGANISVLAAMQEEFKELKLKAASYHSETQAEEDDKSTNTHKGVNKLNALSKKQIAELAKRFEGYTVLAAATSEHGVHICLMSKDGAPCVYTMAEITDVVMPEKIAQLAVKAVYNFGEDGNIEVDVCNMTDALGAEVVKANSEIERLNGEVESANNSIEDMRNIENARRLSAAKERVKVTLDAFNANREEKVESTAVDSILKDVEANVYTNSVDEKGMWTGEKAVENAVLAVCASAVMDMDEKAAKARKTINGWDHVKASQSKAKDGSFEEMLEKWGIYKD